MKSLLLFFLFFLFFAQAGNAKRIAHVKNEIPFIIHTVSNGESIVQLAGLYGLKSETFAQFNGVPLYTELKVGERMDIPLVVSNYISDDRVSENSDFEPIYYEVQDGDGMRNLCAQFHIKENSFAKWNHLSVEDNLPLHEEVIIGWLKIAKVYLISENVVLYKGTPKKELENRAKMKDTNEQKSGMVTNISPKEIIEQVPEEMEKQVPENTQKPELMKDPSAVRITSVYASHNKVTVAKPVEENKQSTPATTELPAEKQSSKKSGRRISFRHKHKETMLDSSFQNRALAPLQDTADIDSLLESNGTTELDFINSFKNIKPEYDTVFAEDEVPVENKTEEQKVAQVPVIQTEIKVQTKDSIKIKPKGFKKLVQYTKHLFSSDEQSATASKKVVSKSRIPKLNDLVPEPARHEKSAPVLSAKSIDEPVAVKEKEPLIFTNVVTGKASVFFAGPSEGKFYVLTNIALPGQMIKITNVENGTSILAEVLDKIPPADLSKGLTFKLSDNVKIPLKQKNNSFQVLVNY